MTVSDHCTDVGIEFCNYQGFIMVRYHFKFYGSTRVYEVLTSNYWTTMDSLFIDCNKLYRNLKNFVGKTMIEIVDILQNYYNGRGKLKYLN